MVHTTVHAYNSLSIVTFPLLNSLTSPFLLRLPLIPPPLLQHIRKELPSYTSTPTSTLSEDEADEPSKGAAEVTPAVVAPTVDPTVPPSAMMAPLAVAGESPAKASVDNKVEAKSSSASTSLVVDSEDKDGSNNDKECAKKDGDAPDEGGKDSTSGGGAHSSQLNCIKCRKPFCVGEKVFYVDLNVKGIEVGKLAGHYYPAVIQTIDLTAELISVDTQGKDGIMTLPLRHVCHEKERGGSPSRGTPYFAVDVDVAQVAVPRSIEFTTSLGSTTLEEDKIAPALTFSHDNNEYNNNEYDNNETEIAKLDEEIREASADLSEKERKYVIARQVFVEWIRNNGSATQKAIDIMEEESKSKLKEKNVVMNKMQQAQGRLRKLRNPLASYVTPRKTAAKGTPIIKGTPATSSSSKKRKRVESDLIDHEGGEREEEEEEENDPTYGEGKKKKSRKKKKVVEVKHCEYNHHGKKVNVPAHKFVGEKPICDKCHYRLSKDFK